MSSVTVVSTNSPPSSSTEARAAKADAASDTEASRAKLRQLAQQSERVAHDFNDLLTLVLGHATLAKNALENPAEAATHLEEIRRSAEQAAVLSQQLLSLARRNAVPSEPTRAREGHGSGYIIIAEDEPMVAELTRRILVHAGHRVRVTHDGQAALDAIRKEGDDIELVVSDIVMPHMSGLELAKALSEERPDLPLLLVSGYPEDDRRLSDETLARTPFLPKPFKAADLLAAIDGLLLRSRARIG